MKGSGYRVYDQGVGSFGRVRVSEYTVLDQGVGLQCRVKESDYWVRS